jgi:hypothetical protein
MDQPLRDHPESSLRYWQENQERTLQMSDVALCLLMAAIQDAVLGEVNRRFRNLNWSATISYYSLVHSGRLVVFSALGDYPMSHDSLRRLLRGEGVRLDWLQAHRQLTQQPRAHQPRFRWGLIGSSFP